MSEQKHPATLTLVPCSCGSATCQRTAFREGMFYQGSGFERPLAEEIKRRYDAHDALVNSLRGLFEHCAMIHKHWGEGDNMREAGAAIEAAHAALKLAEGEGAAFECINCDAPVATEGADCGQCDSQTPSWKFRS